MNPLHDLGYLFKNLKIVAIAIAHLAVLIRGKEATETFHKAVTENHKYLH